MRPGDPTFSIDVEVRHRTAKALCVSTVESNGRLKIDQEWVPISQIDEESEITRESDAGDTGTLIVSEWIAIQKGWK